MRWPAWLVNSVLRAREWRRVRRLVRALETLDDYGWMYFSDVEWERVARSLKERHPELWGDLVATRVARVGHADPGGG